MQQKFLPKRLQWIQKGSLLAQQKFFYRPIFVTGTGTDVGKTYVTALLARDLKRQLQSVGYYKAAISGADSIETSDAGYINEFANLGQSLDSLTSYLFSEAVSPHLAAIHQNQVISFEVIFKHYCQVFNQFSQVIIEGSGGIYCPLNWDYSKRHPDTELDLLQSGKLLPTKFSALEHSPTRIQDLQQSFNLNYGRNLKDQCFTICDFMKYLDQQMGIGIIVVANARLGCINDVVCTVNSLVAEGFSKEQMSVVLNFFKEDQAMYQDNVAMIQALTGVPVIAKIKENNQSISFDLVNLSRILCKCNFD